MTPSVAAQIAAARREQRAGAAPNLAGIGAGAPSRSKYGNVATVWNGRRYASKREATVAQQLWARQEMHEVRDLVHQPRFHLQVNGQHIADYVGDFLWWERVPSSTDPRLCILKCKDGSYDGYQQPTPGMQWFVADAKSAGTRTPVYRVKKRLMLALHGVEIVEL